MTTRNKWYIRLVSLDGHKTLTPLITSKLRVSRITAHHRSPAFCPLPFPDLHHPLHSARCTLHVGTVAETITAISRRVGWPKNLRARDVPSYFHPASSPRATTSSRDNFHKVVSAFSELSFFVAFVLLLGDCYHFSIAIRVPCPSSRSNLVTSV